MGYKKQKIRPYGKPDRKNIDQTNNPKTKKERVQAIADTIESKVRGSIIKRLAKRGVTISDIKYALGTDGQDLEAYIKEIENNFNGTIPKSKREKTIDKNLSPELRKISTEKKVEIKVPGGKNDEINKKKKKK